MEFLLFSVLFLSRYVEIILSFRSTLNFPRYYQYKLFSCAFYYCTCIFLPPATTLGQGNIFTGVCDSVKGDVCSWGGVCSLGVSAPRSSVCSQGGCLLPGGWGVYSQGDVCSGVSALEVWSQGGAW